MGVRFSLTTHLRVVDVAIRFTSAIIMHEDLFNENLILLRQDLRATCR